MILHLVHVSHINLLKPSLTGMPLLAASCNQADSLARFEEL